MIADLSKSSHRYTVDECLALEDKSEVRHEFYNGEIYESLDDLIVLPRLNVELRMQAIYDSIELLPEADDILADEL